MNREDLCRALREKRRAEADAAARAAVGGGTLDSEEVLRRLEAFDQIAAALAPPASRKAGRLWAVAVGLLSVAVAGGLHAVPLWETRLALRARADAASFRLAADWTWPADLPLSSPAHLQDLDGLEAPGLLLPAATPADATVRADRALLSRFVVGRGAAVDLEAGPAGELAVYVREGPLEGELLVWGRTRMDARGLERQPTLRTLAVPEAIRFHARGTAAWPGRLELRPAEPWVLRNAPVSGLALARETRSAPGEGAFRSSLRGATLSLLDSGRELQLREGDELVLEGARGRIVELSTGGELSLLFEGTARAVALGPEGDRQNLSPSVLAFLYHRKPFAFVWSAAGVLWSLAWSVRKTLFD